MPELSPKITVLMTVFNGEKYLAEAIESVLSQTFGEFEFVIVDDVSNDATPQILSDYASRDNRIVVLRNEYNMGPYPSANRGLEIARAEVIARMDADDVSRQDRLERQYDFLNAHADCLLVGSGYRSIDARGSTRFVRPNHLDAVTGRFVARLRMPMVHPSFTFRSKLSDGRPVRYADRPAIAADFGLASALAARGNIASIGDPLVDYRMHDQNISSTRRDRQLSAAHAIASEAVDSCYPSEISEGLRALIDLHYHYASASRKKISDAVKGLNDAMSHEFGGNPPYAVRKRAAGILAESVLVHGNAAQKLFWGAALFALAPRHIPPLVGRALEMRR